jgi:3-phosphoshikimate 1-carboxyvinyltransferase
MAIAIEPAREIRAILRAPGDKSIAHRALLLNALARGGARVANLPPGADVVATISALQALGARVEPSGPAVVRVEGGAGWRAEGPVDCANSGTTARILLGVLAARAANTVTLTGDLSLRGRPMDRVVAPLRAMGARIEFAVQEGRLPVTVEGHGLEGRTHRLPVASAQVKTALLVAGLAARGETTVEEPVLSRDHSERLLAAMGAALARDGRRATIRPGPLEAIDVDVPGDFSSAAPFLALAAARRGSEAVVEDVGLNPTRVGFLAILERMGALVETEVVAAAPEPRGSVRVAGSGLVAVEVGPDEVPLAIDELPLVAVLATQAEGVTRVRGAAELRVKESDRIEAMALGLRAMGARVETTGDGFAIEGPSRLRGAALDARGDHRIAIALAVAALLAEGPSRLAGEEWVEVSYPSFFADLARATGAPSHRARARA